MTSTSKTIQIQKIDQISIRVKDLQQAVQFYKEQLELDFRFTAGGMAFFEIDGVTVMLGVPEKEEFDHPSSVIYFKVEDIGASYQTLSERGVTFRGKPHVVYKTGATEHWMVFFEDPDRNVLALTSQVRLD